MEILFLNFDNEVIDAVNLLTRDDNDSYEEFVQKAASNPISKAVKIADITDNLDLSRISKMTEKDVDRVKKYQRVLKILT